MVYYSPMPAASPQTACTSIGHISPYDNDVTFKRKINTWLKKARRIEKTELAYANFDVNSDAERVELARKLKGQPFVAFGKNKPFMSYLKDMVRCKFTFSPRGYGIDCYRTWEALLVGSIPIIKSSYLDYLYDGLPVLIVKDWNEINEDFLNRKYKQMTLKKYDMRTL